MEALQTLPVWIQLVIVFLVGGMLVFMNIGWLIQARSWLERQSKQRTRAKPTQSSTISTADWSRLTLPVFRRHNEGRDDAHPG